MRTEFLGELGELRRLEQSNVRSLSELRLLLAVCAVALVLSETFNTLYDWRLGVLLPYCAYSVWALVKASRGRIDEELSHSYWFDAACYLTVAGLSGDAASVFAAFLLFPVLVASFHSGLQRGVRIAFVCAISYVALDALRTWVGDSSAPLIPSPWPTAMLLGGGVVIARWSNSEFGLRRHLAILNDLNSLANPCRGLEWALCELAEMLRAYQHADSFIVVIGDPVSGGYLFCRAGLRRSAPSMRIKRVCAEVAQPLLGTTPDVNLLFSRSRRFWQRTIAGAYDRTSLEPRHAEAAELEQIANLLEADSFVAVGLHAKRRAVGRIYATSRRRRFLRSNLGVLQQVVGHAALVIENIELFERLTTEVAMNERQKISRDLHDGTIQPYIGLKIAIDALRRNVSSDSAIAPELDQLAKMTSEGITELRRYANALGEKSVKTGGESLALAVRREAEKFSEFSELNVQVMANTDMQLNEPMLHEVRSIVREGLANIRRHTSAEYAIINLRQEDERLILQFVNEREDGRTEAAVFSPRSLNERASHLGGKVDVELFDDGRTSVSVAIPV